MAVFFIYKKEVAMKKVTIYCPDCGRIAGHYDGRSTIDHPCKCKKCNHIVIYRVATGEIETKPIPKRACSSGVLFI
jgi:hypothetical protein